MSVRYSSLPSLTLSPPWFPWYVVSFLNSVSQLIYLAHHQTCFAFGAAPLSRTNTISHALQAIFWMWLHLLGFNLCNQARGSTTEDLCNKPWRPLPSGRITMANAMTLKVFVIASCMIISYSYSLPVFYASVFLWFFTTVYHEGCGEHHYITRNLLNGLGYGCFALGETLIAGKCHLFDTAPIPDITTTFSVRQIASGLHSIFVRLPVVLHYCHHHPDSRLPRRRRGLENGTPHPCHRLSKIFALHTIGDAHPLVTLPFLYLGKQLSRYHRLSPTRHYCWPPILPSKDSCRGQIVICDV